MAVVVGIGIIGQLALEGGDGGRVVLLEEVAVADAGFGIGTPVVMVTGEVVVEPFQGGGIVLLLEERIGEVVRDQVPFFLAIQGGQVVQVHEDGAGVGVLAVPVVGLGDPVAGELVEGILPGAVVGGGLQVRHRIAEGSVLDQLVRAEEIGLHVVGLHPRVQFVDVVVSRDGGLVVMVREGGHRHVAVDLVPLGKGVIPLHVVVEGRHIVVQVEGEFRVVEVCVLLDVLVERKGGGVLERIQGGHLVAQLDVAVAQLVVRDLAQGIRAFRHLAEALHGALPVLDGIQDGAGVEPVGPVAGRVVRQVLLVVGTGLLLVAEHEVGLGHDAGEVRLAVRRDLVVDILAELDHVVVIFLVETAFEDIVVRKLGEARVHGGFGKPVGRLAEVAQRVAHVAQRVLGRGRVVGRRQALHLLQERPGEGEVAAAEGAVALLVGVFGHLAGHQLVLRDAAEPVRGLPIEPAVEQVLRPAEVHLRDQEGFGPAVQEGFGALLVAGGLEFEGAEGRVTFGFAAGNALQQPGGLRVHAVPVQVQGAVIFRSLGGGGSCKEDGRQGQDQSFLHLRVDYFTNLRIFLIIFV